MSVNPARSGEPGDDQALLDALEARQGVVCFVGAGGKKSTMYRLALAHPGRVGVTTTVHIPYFPVELGAAEVIEENSALAEAVAVAAAGERLLAFARPSEKRGRWAGVDPDLIEPVRQRAALDVVLVKAAGARSRLINVAAGAQLPLPRQLRTLVRVLSVQAVGQRLSEGIAHRVEHISEATGLEPGQTIGVAHLARLLRTETGTDSAGYERILQLNMVDDQARLREARAVAEQVLEAVSAFRRVVLTRANHPRPLMDVLER